MYIYTHIYILIDITNIASCRFIRFFVLHLDHLVSCKSRAHILVQTLTHATNTHLTLLYLPYVNNSLTEHER